jgi:hypothetical protein
VRKDFVFRNYVWLALAGALIAITIIITYTSKAERLGFIGTTVAAALGFCYFVQKQKLDELTLFRSLFAEFNERYALMSDDLEGIRTENHAIDSKQRMKVVRYFNLCAEEFLFYEEGFIHRAAWRSWCLGMKYYLEDSRIRKIWDDEVTLDSYYGLTLELIEAGAKLPRSSKQR